MNNQQMLQEIYEKIGNYIQHGGAIEGGGWKVYDTISLAGVLSALGKMGMFSYTPGHIEQYHVDGKWQTICLRKLLNESGEDAYLDEQSDGTIKSIYDIVCKCNHISDGLAYMTDPVQYKCKECGEMFK